MTSLDLPSSAGVYCDEDAGNKTKGSTLTRGVKVKSRTGFTLIEVVVASTVLVIALFGIMAAAFNTYRKSDITDEYTTASLLAAERLDYFRSQRDPYKAVGGTWYPPPLDRKRDVDFNQDNQVHVIANDSPTLFLREYVVSTSENRFRDPLRDLGKTGQRQRNASAATIDEASARRINWIPDTPETIPAGLPGAGSKVDGIIPNTDVEGTLTRVQQLPAKATSKGGTADRPFNFYRAPRCNEILEFDPGALTPVVTGQKLRGATIRNLSPSVRFVREVWIQTNHPLGRPFASSQVDVAPGGLPTLPGFYTSPAAVPGPELIDGVANGAYSDLPKKIIGRAVNGGNTTLKVSATAIPPWMVAVTIRVFRRDARVASIKPDSRSVNADADGPLTGGLSYDPARPLATMVGYFGLRRFLQ